MTAEQRAWEVLADVVPLSISSTWDEAESRNIIRAMLAFAAETREEAARVAEAYASERQGLLQETAGRAIAAAIRRGEGGGNG